VVFAARVFVTLLIPLLTRYPLFFAFMGDMLGGGFVLALGGFFGTLAAVDSANPYGPMGASRTRMNGPPLAMPLPRLRRHRERPFVGCGSTPAASWRAIA